VTSPSVSDQDSTARADREARGRGARSWARRVVPSRSDARTSTRGLGIRVALVGGSLFALLLLAVIVERVVYAGQVLPGVQIEGVDAEGRSEADVRVALGRLAERLEHSPLQARASNTDLVADPSTVRLVVEREAMLRAARKAGRSRNPFDAVGGFVLRRFRHEEVPLRVDYDERGLEGLLDGWQAQVDDGVREGDLRFDDARVEIIEPRPGAGIVRDTARDAMVGLLESTRRSRIRLEIGRIEPEVSLADLQSLATRARLILAAGFVVTTADTAESASTTSPNTTASTSSTTSTAPPEVTITIEPEQVSRGLDARIREGEIELVVLTDSLRSALGNDVERFAIAGKAARFSVQPDNSVQVVPSTDGRELDLREVGSAILAQRRRIAAPFRVVRPDHDTKWAEGLGIKELVSSFTTHHPCCAARVTNIHTAALLMDGTVLEPGEEFSLNNVVGPRTPERGFVAAPVFYGEFTEDFGGGVSQVATTTFNAAWWGGFEIIDHKPHSIYFSRYPMGREATVNYPDLDLVWRNDSRHGALVKTSFNDNDITVSIYGDVEGKVVREESQDSGCSVGPSFDTDDGERCVNVIEVIEVETVEIPCDKADEFDDPEGLCASLEPGQKTKAGDGYEGYVVELWRAITRPGEDVSRERFPWRYNMLPTKILVGVGPEPTTTTSGPASSTTTTAPATTTTAPGP